MNWLLLGIRRIGSRLFLVIGSTSATLLSQLTRAAAFTFFTGLVALWFMSV